MDKNKKKKAADGTRKGEKRLSDYKSREAEGKSGAEAQFQKAFGTSKDARARADRTAEWPRRGVTNGAGPHST
jgi:hypothetical protein